MIPSPDLQAFDLFMRTQDAVGVGLIYEKEEGQHTWTSTEHPTFSVKISLQRVPSDTDRLTGQFKMKMLESAGPTTEKEGDIMATYRPERGTLELRPGGYANAETWYLQRGIRKSNGDEDAITK